MIKLLLLSFMMTGYAADLPKFRPETVRLFKSHEYIQKALAPDFWALQPYYLPQKPDGDCATTSLAMVFNALRVHQSLGAADELLTNKNLQKKVNVLRVGSDSGIKGVSLDGMGRVTKQLLEKMGISGYSVEVVRALPGNTEFEQKVHKLLVENEKSETDFIIPLFYQMVFTGDPEGSVGHYAPVAAYDSNQKRVLIFDPDRDYYEPYWVSEKLFLEGMNHPKADSKYTGGYVWIHKN